MKLGFQEARVTAIMTPSPPANSAGQSTRVLLPAGRPLLGALTFDWFGHIAVHSSQAAHATVRTDVVCHLYGLYGV